MPWIDVYEGFTNTARTTKHLRDILPDDVSAQSPSSPPPSEAEDSDFDMSPSKRAKPGGGQRGKKKAKKSDGWIWLEGLTRGQTLGEDKLAQYKRESKCLV